jgi:hypothetical protein
MAGLTGFGLIHTIISVGAVIAGFSALAENKVIDTAHTVGQWYVGLTVLTCLTGFGIFQHGGFGKPHVLGIITLVALLLAYGVGKVRASGQLSIYTQAVLYMLTLFFHVVPAITEGLTRLPPSNPITNNPDAPIIQHMILGCLLVFIVGAIWQVLALRKSRQEFAHLS